jgi:hypothetical protein
MKLTDLRKKVGATISYERGDSLFRYRNSGVLTEVKGKNVQIGGEWLWFPELHHIVIDQEPPPPPVRKTRKKTT